MSLFDTPSLLRWCERPAGLLSSPLRQLPFISHSDVAVTERMKDG